jgi:hypothetical protein
LCNLTGLTHSGTLPTGIIPSVPPQSSRNSRDRAYGQRSNVFSEYRRRTGSWPVLSISLYAGRFVFMLAAVSFLFWYSQSHGNSLPRTMIYFLLGTLPIVVAWTITETIAWNHDLRRKGLISKGTIFAVRQLPPE